MRLSLPTALLTGFTFSANLGCKYLCNLIGEDCNPLDDEDEYPSIVATTSDSTQSSGSSTVETPTSTDPSTTAPTTDSTSTSTVTTSSTSDTTMESSDSTAISSSTTMPELCGNGDVDEGEECDDGTNNTPGEEYSKCKYDCTSGPYCGDGIVDIDYEDCDDGDAEPDGDANNDADNNNDGCPNNCRADYYLIFITQTPVDGSIAPIDGLSAADALCNEEAFGMVSGTFKAWLSSSTTPAKDHIPEGVVGFDPLKSLKLRDGQLVAESWDNLLSEGPIVGISKDVTGGTLLNANVWTNTLPNGDLADVMASCADWTSASKFVSSICGKSGQTGDNWTNNPGTVNCDQLSYLYCFQVAF
jgi:hypothetical protein